MRRSATRKIACSSIARVVGLACSIVMLADAASLVAQDSPQETSETVYELGDGVTAPRQVYAPDPHYVDSARKKKISGSVILAVIVTAEGRVREPKVTKSLDKDLDKQALETIALWKFDPATKDGKPVAVHLSVEMTFRLR